MNKRGMDNLKDRLMLNKRGELKYDLLIAFILGLAVVGISLAFLLPSFFSGEIDRQTCKESILLRASIPSANLGLMNLASIREQFPLKCKSEVVNIDYEDNAKAEKIIAETMMSCWVLYGEGKLNLFPQSKFSGNSYCSACARIHIDSKVQEYYKNNPINKVFYYPLILKSIDLEKVKLLILKKQIKQLIIVDHSMSDADILSFYDWAEYNDVIFKVLPSEIQICRGEILVDSALGIPVFQFISNS